MVSAFKDNTAIYFMIEKANLLFADFTIDHVIAFDQEDNFNVIIYTSSDKNFICFTGEEYLQNTDVLPDLIQLVQEYDDTAVKPFREKAVKLIEDKMHSKNNFRLFFDAH